MRRVPVSAIIPVRNGASFIAEALQSVFDQTWIPQEVIVVDDGSTDATRAEVSRFADVIYLQQPPLGLVAARNHGVDRASLPYLAALDADDLWASTKTELQLGLLLARPEIEIVSGQMIQFRHSRSGARTPLAPPATANMPGILMMRRDAFHRVGPYSAQWYLAENLEWWARAMDLGVRTETIPTVVMMRRIHGNNVGLLAENPMAGYLPLLHDIVKRRRRWRDEPSP